MYNSLRDTANDLEKNGFLIRIKAEVSGYLEAAEIHRRVFSLKGPAILFEKIAGTKFQAISNIYGTYERTDFLFRKSLPKLERLLELKVNPQNLIKTPFRYLPLAKYALNALPQKSIWNKPNASHTCKVSDLPLIHSWPMDGGAFITMPQVFTLPPGETNLMKSNVGMYRIQLSGNDYLQDQEIGLHYQLHRGIGIHHQLYNESKEKFKCSIFVGGPPSHAFSAIMPMPEGISELTMAGLLNNKRFRYWIDADGYVISSDADFVITGEIIKDMKKPEGPFGDHLGYYSLTHDFPVMKVRNVYHRKDPLWHFTVVGRPPQEDSSFGYLIHKLVKGLTASEFPGVKEIHAVDVAGVHPLLVAIGEERYMPFREKVPEEILTIANRIMGSGQTSLAKYLFIAASDDDPGLSTNNLQSFFSHVLSRVDWTRDLHFQTKTTIDTLDYSGFSWNAGSKVIIACRGPIKRHLGVELNFTLNSSFVNHIKIVGPGILAMAVTKWIDYPSAIREVQMLMDQLKHINFDSFPLIVLCDDADFVGHSFDNFLWVTFTRSNPSHDIYGMDATIEFKHWGCKGSLIIDARIKSHHAPELIADKRISDKVDQMFEKGGPLYNL